MRDALYRGDESKEGAAGAHAWCAGLHEAGGALPTGGEALQEHTLQLILHDLQISVPK